VSGTPPDGVVVLLAGLPGTVGCRPAVGLPAGLLPVCCPPAAWLACLPPPVGLFAGLQAADTPLPARQTRCQPGRLSDTHCPRQPRSQPHTTPPASDI